MTGWKKMKGRKMIAPALVSGRFTSGFRLAAFPPTALSLTGS
jgi:hypothetical protein